MDDQREIGRTTVGEVRHVGDSIVIALVGELDLYDAPAVREALLACCAETPARLVVDLGEVTFVDSTVLGVLVEARSRMTDGRGFALAAPGLETKRALEVSGLVKHFAIHRTVEAALRTSR